MSALRFIEQSDDAVAMPAEATTVPPTAGAAPDSVPDTLVLAGFAIDPGDDPAAWHLPPPGIHTTGTQLRRRLVTAESIEALETVKPSLLQRLFRRS